MGDKKYSASDYLGIACWFMGGVVILKVVILIFAIVEKLSDKQ